MPSIIDMKKTPLVSVIIPTYNRSHCICEAIDSALNQTYKSIEVIVVDDGSSDDTKKLLKPYKEKNKIKYFYQPNSGVSAARNSGIRIAKGEWIAFLDSDDEWEAEKLTNQIQYALENPEIVAHATNSIIEHNNQRTSLFQIRGNPDFAIDGCTIDRPLFITLQMQFFTTPSLMIKKQTLIEAGLFDVTMSLYEDLDCFARVALLGAWGATNKQLTKVFRKGPNTANLSIQHIQDPTKSPKSRIRIYKKLLKKQHLLNHNELSFARQGISSNFFELALLAQQNNDYFSSLTLLKKSILAHPTPKVITKAFLNLFLGRNLYERIRTNIKNDKNGFRRSAG